MNRTLSGAIAVGGDRSAARITNESKFALEEDDLTLLFSTEEGKMIISKFAISQGCESYALFEEKINYAFSVYKDEFSIFLRGVAAVSDFI